MNIKERIAEIINDVCGFSDAKLEEINLFEEGMLSSLTVLQMVGELDEAFDIDIDIDDVTYDNFCSLTGIVALVERLAAR